MRIPRFFIDQPLHINTPLQLPEAVSHHMAQVLRMRANDTIILFNGQGGCYQATLMHIEKKRASVFVSEFFPDHSTPLLNIHIGQGLSRGERMDYAVQKATELGVTTITPLFTQRSEVKLVDERALKRQHHWQHVAISACEQCARNTVPTLAAPLTLSDWLTNTPADLKIVLHHEAAVALTNSISQKPDSIAILIGPEGGLEPHEISMAQQNGFQAVVMGPRILRTETAPVVVLSVLQQLWGDFR